jgi:hypothetical protein
MQALVLGVGGELVGVHTDIFLIGGVLSRRARYFMCSSDVPALGADELLRLGKI